MTTHYLIDGYNWLFRFQNQGRQENLKIERDLLIQELSIKLSMANLEATLVFDAQFTSDPAERHYTRDLAVDYTNVGQTADEYILEYIKHKSRPQDYTIVTSDNQLAWRVRQRRGKSLSILEFKKMLERICEKKQAPKPKPKPTISIDIKKPETDFERWRRIFENGA